MIAPTHLPPPHPFLLPTRGTCALRRGGHGFEGGLGGVVSTRATTLPGPIGANLDMGVGVKGLLVNNL
eukprot:752599-Hanusia_phi.AAC.5